MKLILPCIAARSISLTPSGMARSVLVAPAKGGTSGQRLLTVTAFSPPVSDSIMRQETATPKRSNRAKIAVDFRETVVEYFSIGSSIGKTIVDLNGPIQNFGVRRQSEAATALWILKSHGDKVRQVIIVPRNPK